MSDTMSHSDEVSELRKGIYVASKVKHAEKWRDLRHWEKDPIISTWIDEAGEGESASLEDLWRRCVYEASNAGALIIYREPDEVLKGAWVELGAALANGVPVFAVGIQEYTVANHAGITHFDKLHEARHAARHALSRRSASNTAGGEDVSGEQVLNVAHRIQSIMSEKLTVDEGEIVGVGPASYKIARLFKPAPTIQAGGDEPVASAMEVAGWTDKMLADLAAKDPWTYADQTQARGLLMSFKGILAAAIATRPATPVSAEVTEAIVRAVKPYTITTLFVEELREIVRAALATLDRGRG